MANFIQPIVMVELVGLAGAGKTTLARALTQRDPSIVVAADIGLRQRSHLGVFARHFPRTLPLFLHRCWAGRPYRWDEMKAMVYLDAWSSVLRKEARRHCTASYNCTGTQNCTILLLDHGPIFKLATLHAFGPGRLRDPGQMHWWESAFEQWTNTLDVVIWLHTPYELLVERINFREQRHAIKGRSEEDAYAFLRQYEMSYQHVLAEFAARAGSLVIDRDSSKSSIEQLAEDVLAICQRSCAEQDTTLMIEHVVDTYNREILEEEVG